MNNITLNDILNLNQIFQPLFAVKIVLIIAAFVFLIFTFVVFNQIRVMNDILSEEHSSLVLKIIGILNIFLAFSLFIFVLVIL
ncbi:hypothetical protein C4559_01285 [Candidatus Microgenomates bacterium]|nr:MAG: hypothetical protein C4559_01285 [Candidatus Microgenomates bacterium]